jgi:hypothetical protein
VRDLEQPGRFEFGRRATLDPAEGVHERDLRRIFGFLAAAELVLAEREDLALMALVQQACCFTLGREPGWNRCRMAFGRYCGHVSPHVKRASGPVRPRRPCALLSGSVRARSIP